MNTAVQILGILNITRDSFSDGGRHLSSEAALAHARQLLADGAAIIDVGAESTHPDAEAVSPEEEIARLTPVVRVLKAEGAAVSVDTHKAAVMRAMIALGADFINDVTALRDPEAVAVVRDADTRVILMHSTAVTARAERQDVAAGTIVARVRAFFEQRLAELETAGIALSRLILDPGMGFFLGRDPAVSLAVLRNLPLLRALGRPVCLSTSRKSFIGALLGSPAQPRPVDQRAAGTLATELWALAQGVDYLRTHDVRALHDAAKLWNAIAARPAGG
ncbi:MAG: dihydropteroate synthase [Planctomycetota bacterium]